MYDIQYHNKSITYTDTHIMRSSFTLKEENLLIKQLNTTKHFTHKLSSRHSMVVREVMRSDVNQKLVMKNWSSAKHHLIYLSSKSHEAMTKQQKRKGKTRPRPSLPETRNQIRVTFNG